MANNKSQRQIIPLASTLHLNQYNGDIKQFQGFNKNNAPYFGDMLSPLYKQIEDTPADNLIVTKDGDEYYSAGGVLYKNGSSVMTFNQYGFTREKCTFQNSGESFENIVAMKYLSNENTISVVWDQENEEIIIYYGDIDAPLGKVATTITSVVSFFGASIQGLVGDYIAVALSYDNSTESVVRLLVYDPVSLLSIPTTSDTTITSDSYYYEFPYIVVRQIADVDTDSVIDDDSPTFCISCAKHVGARLTTAKQDTTQEIYNFYARATDDYEIVEATISNHISSFTGSSTTKSVAKLMQDDGSWTATASLIDSGEDGSWDTSGRSTYYLSLASANHAEYYSSGVIRVIVESAARLIGEGTAADLYRSYDLYTNYNRLLMQADSDDGHALMISSSIPDDIKDGVGYQEDTSVDDPILFTNMGDQYPLLYNDTVSHFRLLYNNGLISGICYCDSTRKYYKQIGILLEEWNIIDTDFIPVVSDTWIVYKNASDGYFYKITFASVDNNAITFVDNRYIIINTTSYKNMYDTKLDKVLVYANSYNGWYVNAFGNQSIYTQSTIADAYSDYDVDVETACVATGINANYELTTDPNFAIQLNPVVLYCNINMQVPYIYRSFYFDCSHITKGIDYYYSAGSSVTAAEYAWSVLKPVYNAYASFYINHVLDGVYFPISSDGNILYSPNIFSEYIKSYTLQDFIINNTIGYPIVYNNLLFMFGYYLLSGIYNISDMFTINGQTYAITNDNLIIFTISDGEVTSTQAVCDISSLQYIAATPSVALFWSPSDYSIYGFTGDRTLSKLYEATKITTISNSWYNPGNQTIFVAYDSGLIIITQKNMFELAITDILNIYFTDTDFVVVTSSTVYYFRFKPDSDGDYTSNDISIETEYYGLGNNQISIIDTWYIRLYNNGSADSGTVTISADLITDITKNVDSKKIIIKSTEWDDNGCYYIRYQPRYQKSIGAKLIIDSPFPITDISVSISSSGESQITKNNI